MDYGGAHHTVRDGTPSPFYAQNWLIIAEAAEYRNLV